MESSGSIEGGFSLAGSWPRWQGGRCRFSQLTGVLLLLAVLCLLGCSARPTSGRIVPGHPPERSGNPANQERLRALLLERQQDSGGGDYVISPGDLIVVTIYNFRPEGGNFESEVRVDDRGYLSLPMIDPVQVASLTTAQLRSALIAALQQHKVLTQPLVGVFLKDYRGQGVIVLGAVGKPGLYYLSRGGQTLIDVLSMAGGLNQNAGNYVLFRPAAKNGTAAPADAVLRQAALGSGAANAIPTADADTIVVDVHTEGTDPTSLALPMRSGDQLIVPEAGQAFIEGNVAKPGPVPLVYGMTLTQLISAVGGFTYPADRQHVLLIRPVGSGESAQWTVDVDRIQRQEEADVVLQRNDRVVVQGTGGRSVAYGVYKTLTAIVHLGVGGNVGYGY